MKARFVRNSAGWNTTLLLIVLRFNGHDWVAKERVYRCGGVK
jgi:hypothetical protein